MFTLSLLLILGGLSLSDAAGPIHRHSARQSSTNTAFVHLANDTGPPQHLASGVLYGIPDTTGQIPDHFFTGMGFRYTRVGGSQYGSPSRGWIWGANEYEVSVASWTIG